MKVLLLDQEGPQSLGGQAPVQSFIDYGKVFIVVYSIENLVVGMNKLIGHKNYPYKRCVHKWKQETEH